MIPAEREKGKIFFPHLGMQYLYWGGMWGIWGGGGERGEGVEGNLFAGWLVGMVPLKMLVRYKGGGGGHHTSYKQ